ncbi:MAG: type I methionyl aminopeptidase [Patescibacteria group bacterium]
MIKLKTKEEIKTLREGGKILGEILLAVAAIAVPGASTMDLEEKAIKLIEKAGGKPSFKGYKSRQDSAYFPCALCTSINEEVVHGLSTPARYLRNGDLLCLDIGMRYKKLFTDTALTVGVGEIDEHKKKLIAVTRECLDLAIQQSKPGNKLLDIARAVQINAEANGFGVVRELVGHGVGHAVHEEPQVPNFYDGEDPDLDLVLTPGLVIAIEPMVTAGDWRVKTGKDGFTIVTKDKSLAAHFEHTIAITEEGNIVITAAE